MADNARSEEWPDLATILQAFGVEHWTHLDLPERSPGMDGALARIAIAGRPYLLRERPEVPAAQGNEHVYAFGRYLAGQGLSIAACYLSPQGEPYVNCGGGAFELQEWSEDAVFASGDGREKVWISGAGELLGRLHQASLHYQGPPLRWPAEAQAGALTQGWLQFASARAQLCALPALAAAFSTLIATWEAALPAAMMAIGTGERLPELHIHGDYSPLHLRFGPAGICQILGLEASRWEKRLLEVACGVFCFAGLRWGPMSDLARPLAPRGLDPERAALFLRSYGAVYPPQPGEAARLVDALTLLAPILSANGPLEDLFYESMPAQEPQAEDALARLAWATGLPGWLARARSALAQMW
jgi:Ser/Thr protein kinase RdoA (MazF antagonist)